MKNTKKYKDCGPIFYVYKHMRRDTGLVFYIGKGKGDRAFSRRGRNPYWRHIVDRFGYDVCIVKDGLYESEAFLLEKELIRQFGRKDIKNGFLVNLTDGGDGPAGAVPWNLGVPRTEDEKRKMSKNRKGKPGPWKGKKIPKEYVDKMKVKLKEYYKDPENRKKAGEKNKGRPSNKKGKKMPEEQRLKLIGRKRSPEVIELMKPNMFKSGETPHNKESFMVSKIDSVSGKIIETKDIWEFCNGNCQIKQRIKSVCNGSIKSYKGFIYRFYTPKKQIKFSRGIQLRLSL